MTDQPAADKDHADLALETRIVAMVLGEASDFEKAELAEILQGRPDLAAFTRRLAALDRLGHEALGREKNFPDPAWQLGPERRKRLEEVFGTPLAPASIPVLPGRGQRTRKTWGRRFWLQMAAGFVLLGVLFATMQFVGYLGMRATLGSGGISDPRALDEAPWFAGGLLQRKAASAEVALSGPAARQSAALEAAPPSVPSQPALFGVVEADSAGAGRIPGIESRAQPVATAPSRGAGVSVALPSATPSSAVDSEVASGIQLFTGGWAKGSGTGTGVRARSYGREDELAPPTAAATDAIADTSEVRMKAGKDARLTRQLAEGKDLLLSALEQAAAEPQGVFFREESRRKSGSESSLFENATRDEAVSTFSLHVADVSFRLAKDALLAQNQLPDAASVRAEEFTAAFDYGDPAPAAAEAVALAQDQSVHPFVPGSNLLRLSLRTAATGRDTGRPLNLFVVLDKSGSMERPDRTAAANNALAALASQLEPADQMSLVTFERETRLVADRIPGDAAGETLLAAQQSIGESGTNLEQAMASATQIAADRMDPLASNRVMLVTDGIANLGTTVPEQLAANVRELRNRQIAVDVVAVGARGVGDAVLGAMARNGDGRYFLLEDGAADAELFAEKLAGAFRPAANDVKVQVRFNPRRVTAWSLLGYDAHRLREQDFRDDTVDAAELAAAEQGTALYQIQLDPDGEGEVGQVSVRFRQTDTGQMVERSWVIPYDPVTPPFDRAAPPHQLAGVATLLAERLRGTPTGSLVQLEALGVPAANVREHFRGDPKVGDLADMLARTRVLEPGW